MQGRALALVALALLAGIMLSGCAEMETDPLAPDEDDGAGPDDEEGLDEQETDEANQGQAAPSAERLSPRPDVLTASVGEQITFEAQCHNPEENLAHASWAIRRPGAGAYEILTNDTVELPEDPWGPASEQITFETEGEALVRWTCVTHPGDLDAAWWEITVTKAGDDDNSSETSSEGASETDTAAANGNLTVHFVDVGQGDGIVVHHPDVTAIYDTGRWHGESQTAVRDHLQAESADPDVLLISHPDGDHAGGCDDVLKAFAIEAIYHPGLSKDTQTWTDCENAMQAEGAPIHTDADLDVGQTLDWTATGEVQLLHIDASASDPNEGSIALGLTHGEVQLVLAGDIGCETEEAILERGLLDDPDIIQVGHHGSKYSTCSTWLEATQPEAGVISVGDNNYGHPTQEVLDRLSAHAVDVYRTDHHGTVEVSTNGTTWDVRTDAGQGAYEHDATSDNDTEADAGGDGDGDTSDSDEEQPAAEQVHVGANVSEAEPCQYTDVSVFITAEDGEGQAIEGASTTSTWHYKSSSPSEEGTTDANGEDEHTRYISGASAGYEVVIDVDVEAGQTVGEGQTSFTPREC